MKRFGAPGAFLIDGCFVLGKLFFLDIFFDERLIDACMMRDDVSDCKSESTNRINAVQVFLIKRTCLMSRHATRALLKMSGMWGRSRRPHKA